MQLLGERLRTLREGLNMTQYQVGEILGIPQTSIHRYEIGAYTPTAETLVWYADYFDVSMDYIFGRTDQPQGKLYDCVPEVQRLKEEQRKEMEQFIEMCFDPKSEASRIIRQPQNTSDWKLMHDYKTMKTSKGSGRAIIALTRKIARIVFAMLNTRTPFNVDLVRMSEKDGAVA